MLAYNTISIYKLIIKYEKSLVRFFSNEGFYIILLFSFFLKIRNLLLLGQHIVLSHGAFRLGTERVGHDETVGILHLEVRSLTA